MESVQLDPPAGIMARLGWDPATGQHDRIHLLARQLVALRLDVDESDVHIDHEPPAVFWHHTQLKASVGGAEVPLAIKTASYRAASVVAVCPPEMPLGIDIRDQHPDPLELADMRRHSHLWSGGDDDALLWHWTRVQAILQADPRGTSIAADHVRLDPPLGRGWLADRKDSYRVVDLSRNGFLITIAYEEAVRVPSRVPVTGT